MARIFWGLSYQATGPQLKTTRLQLVCGTPLAGPAHAGKHDQRTQPKRDNQNENRNKKDLASSSVHNVTPFPLELILCQLSIGRHPRQEQVRGSNHHVRPSTPNKRTHIRSVDVIKIDSHQTQVRPK